MKTKLFLIGLVLCVSWQAARAQSAPPADLQMEVSNLTVKLAALEKLAASADTNPPAPVMVAVTFSNGVAVATNTVNTTTTVDAVGAQIAPFLHLLGGGSPWVSKTIAWLAAVSMALAPFRPRIKIYIADWFNRYSATASADQDAWLMALFSKPWYVGGSLLLRFAGIPLPTKADLERNIALQKETAAAAVIAATVKV